MLIAVDRLSKIGHYKMAHYIPTTTDVNSKGIAMNGDYPKYKDPVCRVEPKSKGPTPAILNEFAERLSSLNSYLRAEIAWTHTTYAD